mgnify:FL=1
MRLSRSDISMSSISCTLAERKERVQEMLKLVQLDGFGNRKITQMSGGQKQKHLTQDNPVIMDKDDFKELFERLYAAG